MKTFALSIALYPIFGYPVIMYGGITAALLLVTVALIGRKAMKNPGSLVNKHVILAYIAIAVAFGHGLLGLMMFL